MKIDTAQLGMAIRQIRDLRGYTQGALGDKSGLRGNTIALIERGERGVSLDALNALAEALEVPAACLTMLGTSSIKGDSKDIGLVKSMQELILSTIVAQSRFQEKEKAERANQAKVESIASSPKLRAIAKKIAGASKGASRTKSRQVKKSAKPKPRKRLEPA
jgi:transcriptional regulator with XRE-family HTH domain